MVTSDASPAPSLRWGRAGSEGVPGVAAAGCGAGPATRAPVPEPGPPADAASLLPAAGFAERAALAPAAGGVGWGGVDAAGFLLSAKADSGVSANPRDGSRRAGMGSVVPGIAGVALAGVFVSTPAVCVAAGAPAAEAEGFELDGGAAGGTRFNSLAFRSRVGGSRRNGSGRRDSGGFSDKAATHWLSGKLRPAISFRP